MIHSIDPDAVNRLVLYKQHLAENTVHGDIVQITADICGLHATSPTTPYLSLFSRLKGFKREDLDYELYVKKSLGRVRCVRKTVYILPKEMIPAAYAATRKITGIVSTNYCKHLGVTGEEYAVASGKILDMLKGKPMTAAEVKKSLNTDLHVSSILNLMCDEGQLMRGMPKTGWKSNLHTYYHFGEYFPGLDLNSISEDKAIALLVSWYLRAFGPVTIRDVIWWTGLNKRSVEQALKRLEEKTIAIDVLGFADDLLMLRTDESLIKTIPRINKPVVNLLPSLDPYIMGYKDRDRYLDPGRCEYVFDRSGNATSTILIDGNVAGVWDIENSASPSVKLFLFDEVERGILSTIRQKAAALGSFVLDKECQVKLCDSMIPLINRTAGAVMSPLKGSG